MKHIVIVLLLVSVSLGYWMCWNIENPDAAERITHYIMGEKSPIEYIGESFRDLGDNVKNLDFFNKNNG